MTEFRTHFPCRHPPKLLLLIYRIPIAVAGALGIFCPLKCQYSRSLTCYVSHPERRQRIHVHDGLSPSVSSLVGRGDRALEHLYTVALV